MKLRYVKITIEWFDTIFDNQAYLYISVDTFYPSLPTNLTTGWSTSFISFIDKQLYKNE